MHIWVAAFCGLVLCGCSAPKDAYTLTPSNNQQAVVRDGVPALVSSRKHVVFLRPLASHQVSYARPRFVVALLNRGKAPATLKVSDIIVESTRPRRAKMRVFTHAELAQEVETQRNTQLVLGALSAAAGAYSAAQSGYSQTTGSYSGTGPYGSSYGTYSATTYNPAVAQVAAEANAERAASNLAGIEAQAQGKLAELQATVIKDHTLMPGEWHGGVIVLAPPEKGEAEGAEYSISITFDGEQHSFTVSQRKST
jgi:hypothetical protein